MSKIASTEADVAGDVSSKWVKVASPAAGVAGDGPRERMQVAQRSAALVNGPQRQPMGRLTEDVTEFRQLFVQLLSEQARHNLQVATAMGRVFNWGEVAKAQIDFLRGSFERMNRLSGRYREITQAGMKAMAFTARS